MKYTETIVKVEFNDNKIFYYSQNEFNDLKLKDVINVYIYGVLTLFPTNQFKGSNIKNFNGPFVIFGDATYIFENIEKYFT